MPDTPIKPFTVGFLLFPNFAMLSFSSVIEPLRIANRLSNQPLYDWKLLSLDDQAVVASNGIAFTPTLSMQAWQALDAVLLVAGMGTHLVENKALFVWLRQVARSQRLLGSTSTGSVLLAKAGVLKDRRCTIHWEDQASLQESFPNLIVSRELFELSGTLMTCSGGTAGLDMMLALIERQQGRGLSRRIAEQCIHPSIRASHEAQRMSVEASLGIHSPVLSEAVTIMRSHYEDPLNCNDIARLVAISPRQLQRLFKQHFGQSPGSYYLLLRLRHAEDLLTRTSLSVLTIATATGFSSTSHFSKCFRKQYGVSPRAHRAAGEPAST